MRLAGAFFANKAEVVDDMLNVEGGFWASTTAPAGAVVFQCHCVSFRLEGSHERFDIPLDVVIQ